MRIFIRFSYHFFSILWHFRAVFLSLIALMVGIAAAIRYFENMPFDDALYLSFITGLTIGYGDIVVKTPFGRIMAVLLGFIGIIFTGMMVAAAIRAVGESMEGYKNRKNQKGVARNG
jgi:voltage-gated potassium channel